MGIASIRIHAKIRTVTYLSERMASERIVWVPAGGTLSVGLDGRRRQLAFRSGRQPRYSVTPNEIWQTFTGRTTPRAPREADDVQKPCRSRRPEACARAGPTSSPPTCSAAEARVLKVRTRLRRHVICSVRRWRTGAGSDVGASGARWVTH